MTGRPLFSRPWLWAHLLSLEAPAVAVGWTAALSRCHGLTVPSCVLAGLALVVWVIYLLDRTLDTLGLCEAELDLRHQFYLRHRVRILGAVVPMIVAVIVWLCLRCLPSGLLVQAVAIALITGAYLAIYTDASTRSVRRLALVVVPVLLITLLLLPVTVGLKMVGSLVILLPALLACAPGLRRKCRHRLRKEMLSGAIFALGCATYARFELGMRDLNLWLETVILALLFAGNLTLISEQERPVTAQRDQRAFLFGATLVCACLGCLGFFVSKSEAPAKLAVLVIAGLLLHWLLWISARRRSPEAFRVLADAALLAPPMAVWFCQSY